MFLSQSQTILNLKSYIFRFKNIISFEDMVDNLQFFDLAGTILTVLP